MSTPLKRARKILRICQKFIETEECNIDENCFETHEGRPSSSLCSSSKPRSEKTALGLVHRANALENQKNTEA